MSHDDDVIIFPMFPDNLLSATNMKDCTENWFGLTFSQDELI